MLRTGGFLLLVCWALKVFCYNFVISLTIRIVDYNTFYVLFKHLSFFKGSCTVSHGDGWLSC